VLGFGRCEITKARLRTILNGQKRIRMKWGIKSKRTLFKVFPEDICVYLSWS